MDSIDHKILLILLQDGRRSYEKIAKKVELSPNAVKNRIDKLVKSGIIQRFSAYLNPPLFNKSICFTLTTVQEGIIQSELVEKIRNYDASTKAAIVAATISLENKMTIIHHFSSGNELNETVERIKQFPEVFSLKNYILLIPQFSNPSQYKITKNDWRIIKALSDNCRKSETELATELNLSTKTVSRRLKYLTNNAILICMIDWDTSSGGLLTYELIVTCQRICGDIIGKIKTYIHDVLYIWRVSNEDVLIITVKINHLREIEEHVKILRTMPEITEIETYVPTQMFYYRGWSDEFIEEELKKVS